MNTRVESCGKPSSFKHLINSLISEILFPLFVIIFSPNFILLISYIIVAKNSDLRTALPNQALNTLIEAWNSIKWNDLECWSVVVGLFIWCIVTLLIPGRKYFGPPTNKGYRPQYWDTGFKFYIITLLIAVPVIWNYSVLHLYYKIPILFSYLIVFGFILSVILYLKGLTYPNKGVCMITKNPIIDFYWGVELYPYLGPFISLKMLIISRYNYLLWGLLAMIAWKANYELYLDNYNLGNINWPLTTMTLIILVYLGKLYYLEESLMLYGFEYIHLRLGFYLTWGSIAFMPAFFSFNSLYMVKYSPLDQFGFISCLVVFSLGVVFTLLSLWVDLHKMIARQTNGKCVLWGKPAKVIRAKYIDINGKTKQSILLVSGFWGVARHMNYTFELMVALLTCVPALTSSPIPYLYFIFTLFFIINRLKVDNNLCSQKYGVYWQEYCELVPYKLIPGIF